MSVKYWRKCSDGIVSGSGNADGNEQVVHCAKKLSQELGVRCIAEFTDVTDLGWRRQGQVSRLICRSGIFTTLLDWRAQIIKKATS